MSIKKLSFILAILFFIMPFSIFSYASKVPTKSEGKYPPLKFAAKYGDSVYINKTEDHNFMVIGNKTIPIRIKYFYNIKNMLLFLGEDSTLYLSDNKAANIKILLKDVNAAVISDEKGDYAYAVNKKGELYRVTVESKKN
ncbi:MAG TPA: hypothetical protein VHT34_10735 [Clostridia bacterium]|nr:hypothetical protein [Clostridia bacterium]